MPCRLYEINHPYSLARALQAAVQKAVATGDDEVLGPLRRRLWRPGLQRRRPVIMHIKNALLVNNG